MLPYTFLVCIRVDTMYVYGIITLYIQDHLKEHCALSATTACTVTFQFTEPVNYVVAVKAITSTNPKHVSIWHSSYVHLPMYTYPCTPTHVHLPMYIYPCTPTHVHLPMYTYPCTPTHVHLPMYTYPCTYAYLLMYVHLCSLVFSLWLTLDHSVEPKQ